MQRQRTGFPVDEGGLGQCHGKERTFVQLKSSAELVRDLLGALMNIENWKQSHPEAKGEN